MIKKKGVGAACCFLMALFASAHALAGQKPQQIVAEIYRIAAGPKHDYSGPSALDRRAVRARFTPSLRKAMEAMERRSKKLNEPILDFDPVTNSQEPSVADLNIETEREDAGEATVAASFVQEGGKGRTTVRYLFRNVAGEWKLDDVTGDASGDKWDLRKIMKGE